MSDYDRAITVFSPDGHLLQVQYAAEAVNRGLCCVGVKARKIEVVDAGMALAFAGLSADGRALVNRARVECQSYRLTADEAPGADYVARWIAQLQQKFTMRGGMRPFGVACLVAGFDGFGRPALFKTEPHGILVGWKAHAVGRNDKPVIEYLEKEYKEDLDRDSTIKLALSGLCEVVDAASNSIEAVVVETDEKGRHVVTPLSDEELMSYVKPAAAAAGAEE